MKGDYYEILGIPRDATKEEAKDAYRRLALQYHPDRNKSPDAEEMFKEISEAYAVLSDDERRREYDEFGHPGIDQRYTYEEIIRTTDFESVFKDLEFDFGGPSSYLWHALRARRSGASSGRFRSRIRFGDLT